MASAVCVASTMIVAPAAATVTLSSSRSVSFNNAGLRGTGLSVRAAPVRSLCVRAGRDPRKPDDENVMDKVKNAVSDLTMKAQDIIPGDNSGNQSTGSPGRKPGVGRQGQPEHKSSTGGITEAAKEMAEKTAVVFDGVKENVMDKLQDNGRDLKSKTGDVNFGAHRNADGIPADSTKRNNQAQSEYTKNLGKKN
ncbi:hypothetical protein MPTK1_2g15740 [Marchantia polymorpha subsp. ruderalis]|uniref:Uncharacterized protein n=2 Tax=Marchantia polymorpha TaxID=3197 RepID=A0A176WKQ9_MARPO|nr:hypothetical protein AXG93_2884s1230 [Marchantia polymorpha subsp. ruderalis]PTQ26853.1 hypothetical protein MARPO_0312s0001 [Marchantia polymorpha]BBN02491.1 hypothetical protein Mp_2g15740 [Marchantia polymorpha subsp. ruderalis]|eukprot:PTQ26853.1 hypothetical protein MARPO_0312s0001 [Marchantia polymorpha]